MSSDDSRRQGSNGFRQPGVGHLVKFRCAECNNPSQSAGRRLLPVHGLRQWVCAACAKARAS